MKSRAYDRDLVVHITAYKGSMTSLCADAMDPEQDRVPTVTPMFLPQTTPVTCMQCMQIEETKDDAPEPNDDH